MENGIELLRNFYGKWSQYFAMFSSVTRNSADVDKPRDAFRGQSRSPNDMLGMVYY